MSTAVGFAIKFSVDAVLRVFNTFSTRCRRACPTGEGCRFAHRRTSLPIITGIPNTGLTDSPDLSIIRVGPAPTSSN